MTGGRYRGKIPSQQQEPIVNLAIQFETLGRRQLAIQDGIQMLTQLRGELARTRSAAEAWGTVAVLSNITLIPLNVVLNAFELKSASAMYQVLVQQLYGKLAGSGSRLDGSWKPVLSMLKQAIVEELKRRALAELIPGVNILVGLSEDSLAAWQAIRVVESGNREIAGHLLGLERRIEEANRQLVEWGVRRAEILGQMQTQARTA